MSFHLNTWPRILQSIKSIIQFFWSIPIKFPYVHRHSSIIHQSSISDFTFSCVLIPSFLLSFHISISLVHLVFISMPAQVEQKLWGTTWMVTQEFVCWHLSTAASPTIPTWYRFTEDKQRVLCLDQTRKPEVELGKKATCAVASNRSFSNVRPVFEFYAACLWLVTLNPDYTPVCAHIYLQMHRSTCIFQYQNTCLFIIYI